MIQTPAPAESAVAALMPLELYEAFQAGISLAESSEELKIEAQALHSKVMTELIDPDSEEATFPNVSNIPVGLSRDIAHDALRAAVLGARKIGTDRRLARLQDTTAGLYVGRRVLATPAINGTKPLVEFAYSGGLTGLHEWTPREVPYFQKARGPIRHIFLRDNNLGVYRDNLTGRINKAFQQSQVIDTDTGLPLIRLQFLDN